MSGTNGSGSNAASTSGGGSNASKDSNAAGCATPPVLQQDFETFYHKVSAEMISSQVQNAPCLPFQVCSGLQDRGEVHSMSKLFSTADDDEKRMLFMLQRNFGNAATSGTTAATSAPAPTPPQSQSTTGAAAVAGAGGAPPNATNGTLASWGNWRDFNFKHKDKAESQRLRNLGNQVCIGIGEKGVVTSFLNHQHYYLFQVYQKNKLTDALEYYSQSICYAPHPPPPNSFLLHGANNGGPDAGGGEDGTFTHEELALGFANRSAVLFQASDTFLK